MPIKVLVTAIGGGGHGDQILKALRMAPQGRYVIFGADANPACPQSSLVDKFVTIPFASSPNYLTKLISVCNQLGVQALFHGCEPELQIMAANRELIQREGIFLPINDTSLIQLCMDKIALNQRLTSLGFSSLKCVRISNIAELKEIDWFPVVVKPSVGSGGSANVFIAQDSSELYGIGVYLGLGERVDGFMVQEYVGTPDSEFTVSVLHDLNGEYINSIALRRHLASGLSVRTRVKNRTGRTELGEVLVISSGVSQGDIGRFSEVTDQCRKIADGLCSKGPLNIQCRYDKDQVKVFEINPRYSGTTSIRAMAGYNEPDILIQKHLCSKNIEVNFNYKNLTVLRTLTESIMS